MKTRRKGTSMEIDTNFRKKIEEFATLQFTDIEIAKISGIPVKKLIAACRDDIDRGRLLAEAEVRKSVLKSAKEGSAPAQKQFMEFNRRAKYKQEILSNG